MDVDVWHCGRLWCEVRIEDMRVMGDGRCPGVGQMRTLKVEGEMSDVRKQEVSSKCLFEVIVPYAK